MALVRDTGARTAPGTRNNQGVGKGPFSPSTQCLTALADHRRTSASPVASPTRARARSIIECALDGSPTPGMRRPVTDIRPFKSRCQTRARPQRTRPRYGRTGRFVSDASRCVSFQDDRRCDWSVTMFGISQSCPAPHPAGTPRKFDVRWPVHTQAPPALTSSCSCAGGKAGLVVMAAIQEAERLCRGCRGCQQCCPSSSRRRAATECVGLSLAVCRNARSLTRKYGTFFGDSAGDGSRLLQLHTAGRMEYHSRAGMAALTAKAPKPENSKIRSGKLELGWRRAA